jgi:hypothetical protein
MIRQKAGGYHLPCFFLVEGVERGQNNPVLVIDDSKEVVAV